MARDYYAVLGIGTAASAVQIRRAYQRLARRYSPDVNFWEGEAQGLFEEISQAYRVLGDPSARTLYDRQADAGAPVSGAGSSSAGRRGDHLHVPVELAFDQAAAGLTADLAVDRLSACDACGNSGSRPGGRRLEVSREVTGRLEAGGAAAGRQAQVMPFWTGTVGSRSTTTRSSQPAR